MYISKLESTAKCRLTRVLIKHPLRPYYTRAYRLGGRQCKLVVVPLRKRRYRILCLSTGVKLCDAVSKGKTLHILSQLLVKMEKNKRFKNAVIKTTIFDILEYKKSQELTPAIKLIRDFFYPLAMRKEIITDSDTWVPFKYPPEYINDPILTYHKR